MRVAWSEEAQPVRDLAACQSRTCGTTAQVGFLATGNRLAPTLDARYKRVRLMTRSLTAGLSAEDQMVQSCPDASPVKWHQAHTTWFFETFVLRPFLPSYKPFREVPSPLQ